VNLKEIIEEVHSQLDYNPELQSYKDSVARTASRHYLEISNASPWLFLQTVTNFYVNSEVDATTPGLSFGATLGINNPGPGTRLAIMNPPAAAQAFFAGGRIRLPDGERYRVIRSDPSTGQIYFTGEPGNVRYFGVSRPTYSDWSVTFDRHALPPDCAEPLGFMDRSDQELGRLLFIDRRREEELFLNAQDEGQAFVLIEDDHVQDPPPQFAPTASLAAGGSLPVGVVYEYCYTIMYEADNGQVVYAGRESPPSLVVEAPATTAGNQSVSVGNLQNTQDVSLGAASINTGLLKNLYRRDKTNNGKWVRVASNLAETLTSFVDAGTSLGNGSYGAIVLAGQEPRQYVRAYYTPSVGGKLELRYLRKPRRLVADSDTPEWPEQYHYLLVYRTLQDICMQHGMTNQATMYERRGNEVLNRMKGKWLARSDKNLIRQGFTFGGQTVFERWGNPRKIG
jgi:hypothetical protein